MRALIAAIADALQPRARRRATWKPLPEQPLARPHR